MPQLNVWYNITLIFIIYYDTVFKILILEYYRKIGILFEYNVLDFHAYVNLLATETLLKNDLECYGLHRNRKKYHFRPQLIFAHGMQKQYFT